MSFWNNAWDSITGAFSQGENAGWIGSAASWMENNKVATNLIGNTLAGVGSYFAQKEANKDLMRKERELLNLKDELQSKYSKVPETDFGYGGLTVDNTPNLANGGILTEIKKRAEDNKKVM
ncbi:hypothetical protein [Pasteurella oralis]|uniref:hypothetical protein n=1 Tax=Pasteurella oralis TaxID=1071947 RepID=UPI000C7A4F5A|nr:hypothetical protein [Pasteurella oralis]